MDHPEPFIDDDTLTRNWDELLQEMRVIQTGVQIVTGFLLTVPFSSRFGSLDHAERAAYLIVLCGSVLTTALVVAPVAFHRLLFRRRRRRWLVQVANRCALVGLVVLAFTICGVLALVFDLVAGRWAGYVAFGVALLVFALLWVAAPIRQERMPPPPAQQPGPG